MTDCARSLVRLSAALGGCERAALPSLLDDAARHCDARQVEETLVQSYLFVGYPRALNALAQWRARVPLATSADREPSSGWRARGLAVFGQVYGAQAERVRANVAALHPELEDWMLTEGYGKVLGRPGLELPLRELCVVAVLVPQDAAPQLHAHLRGALQVGAAHDDVAQAVGLAAEFATAGRAAEARRIWAEVSARGAESQAVGGGEDVR